MQFGSPAAQAGVQPDDTILSYNGKEVATIGVICTDLRQFQDEGQLSIAVQRTNPTERTTQELTFTISLGRP